ncbi:cupin domain-containing protein [Mesorhizobium qingshengii]|jgi:quercetin dioxygenase-like cupin family protein|uniref:Cupin domain protein n=1 Tax=Mesorhizobium qingshengii TaxID=1165689 RepID=A0A1G5XJD3_9HYPH|nr:cupin domain-containing protein [Mesorhizobium qingshengii]SDA70442.1 Cupin domain protein [Mesorhizobium qingshengii]
MIGNQSRLRTGQYLAAAGTAAILLALAARWAGQGLIGVTPDGMEGHMHMQGEDAGSPAAARPKTVVTTVSCEKLPDMPGKSVTTAIVNFPPNAYTPRHRHPGSVSAFVLQGTLRSQLEGSPAGTYTKGQTWFEPPGAIHLFAENASTTEPAALLATFIADDDCSALTIPD